MSRFLKVIFVCLSILLLAITISCLQVGLGAQVDTASPIVAIKYPPTNSAIKGSFLLSGTCSDDLGVDSISVSIVDTKKKTSFGPYSATIDADKGTWSVTLNSKEKDAYPLPDSLNYEITVTAADKSKHETTDKRAVIVDNTAPVLILSSPSKSGSETPTTYGRTLKLAGDISDDNTVSSLDLYLKQYDTTSKTLSDEKHIAVSDFTGMSSDSPLVVAQYYSEEAVANDTAKAALRNNYISIYGDVDDNENIDKIFYCRIVLTDNAKTYTVADDSGTGTGNATSLYYINNDNFANNLISEQSYSITASKLKDIIKGEDAGYSDTELAAIKNLLATSGYYASSTTIDSAASSVISMNPDNNPAYSVSNYELSGNLQSSVYKNFTAGSTLYLSLAAGRDKKYVVPSSVSAKLYKLSSATDNDISDTAENDIIVLLNKGDWTDEAALTCDKTFVLSTTNYPQLQKLSQCYFKLVVTGMDRDSTALEPANENGYGFKLTITGNPPILETGKRADTESLENVKDSEYIKSSALKFSGSVSSETNTIKSVTYEVTVKDEDISDEASSTISTYNGSAVCGDGTFDGMEETWSFSLADNESYKEIESGKVYTYTVKIIATDDNSSTTTETRRIHVDTKVPVVEITNVSPLAGTNSTCVNGTVAIEGSISESYKSTAVFTITDGSKTETVKSGSVDSFKTTVDTTSYTDKATLTLTLTATDKAGNTSEVYTKSYTIDQSTDAPVITLSNADITLQESAKITAGKNLFSTTNSNLLGAITDDDGISSVEITYSKTADGEYTSLFKNTEIGGSTTYTITSTTGISFKNLTDGLYYVKLVVTDKAQEKTGYCNTNTDYFVVARDEGAPIFSITSTKNAYQAVGQSFNVSGKAKDSGGNIKIYSSADGTYDSADTLISTIANKTDEQDWSASIAIPSGTTQGSTLYYIAIDLYGQTSIDDFPYKVDPAAPTFTITQLGSNTTSSEMPTKEKLFTSYAQKSSLFIVKGLVDDEGDSGLEDVIYYMVSSTEPAKITGDAAYDTTKGTWNKSTILRQSDGNHWTANLDFSSYDEGTSYTVYLAARDNARNISLLADNPCNKIILTPDGTAPVVGNAVADDDKITNVDINNDVKITASTITEVGSGIASVVLYENGSSIGEMTTSDSGATYTYSIPANSTHLSTGSHTFAVRATDKVGNISADKTIVIAVDTTNPTANISTVTPLTSAGYANGNVTVYATAGDEIELSEISWKVVDGTSVTKKEGTIAVDANDKIYKSFTFALDTREITTTSGTYTLTVTSTDKAENTTTTSGTTLNIDQATDVPVITLDSPATYEPSATVGVGTNLFKSSDSMTGTITDDDGLASIVIKIDTIVTDTIDGGGAKTYALSKSLSALAEGTHTIEVTATDNALGVSKTTNSFSVGIDNGAPTLALSANVTTTKNNIYYANGDLTITAVVKDGYKLGSLEWADTAVTPATGSVTVVQDSTSQTKTITVAKPVANVKSTRTITAKDSFGRTTADTITYDFDVTPPTLTPAALTGVNTDGDLNYFNSSKTLTITGTASDGTATSNDSGLDSVYYAIVEGHYATPTDATTAGKTVTWNLTSGSATWSAKVDLIEKADGNYTVFIKAVDFVGNEKISDAIKLVADKTSPAIAVTTINGVADTSVDTYYNKDTTIVGSLTEANLKQISVSSATCSGTEKTVTVENVSGVLTLSTLTDEGVWAITLSAEDKAGNKGSYTINTTVDKTSPAPVINEANTLAVGGKTFTSSDTSGSWFNQTSLQFIGYYKENGSGIEECSYFLNPATVPTTENVAGLTSNGTFSPASVTGDACKFNVTIANFSVENSGTNTIYFVVKDKAGNYSISSGYIIKVDQDLPNLIREIPSTSTLLSNCATAPAISGTCSDASSGVKSVVVKINGTPISSSITSGSWTATSSEVESVLKPLATSSYPVTAVVTDNAGNSNTVSLFTLTVDKTAPTAAISASIPTSSLNGKKSLSGTVTEDNSPASFTLYYSTSNTDAAAGSEGTIPTSWTKFGDEISDSALIYNWTLGSFDFSENSGTKTDGKADIYLLPVVYDKAGNCNVHADGKTTADFTQCSKKSVKYSVDQNTDRPVIKLSNLSISNSTLMSKTVIGTISDDDGISDFYYTDNSTSAATFATTDTNWKKVTVTDGSWSIEAGKDGSKTWWFYVKDTADGTFLTSNSNSVLTIPYISDSTTKADNSSSLDFKVDTSSPVINNLYVSSDNSTWSNVAGNVFGGTKTNIYAKVNVTEEVGMPTDETKAVSISINGESITLTDSTISSSGANPYEYVLGAIPLSSVSATGTVPLSVTVTDGSGLSTSKTLNISIDNTAPELSITYPSSSDWTTGKVTVKGIASDSGSSVSSVKYLIPTKTQQSATDDSLKTSTTWVTLTNPLAWSIEFNSSAYTNVPSGKLSLEYYATAKESESLLYGTIADSENHPEQCTVPIYFLLEDTTGNVALNRDNKLNVDTEGGKPTCTITYPDENAKTSGVVTIYGTATDDENVSEVRINSIKISTKESPSAETASDWTDVTYNAISASEVVSTGTVTGDSSSWYIKATGTKSWKVAFKSSGLSESDIKAILVSVQSYDENASTCTEQTRLVYIDKNVPKIQTLSLVQFASTPTLVTDTPNVSRTYVSGMYLSKNVGNGSWYLYGEITDDTSVKAITISSETDASVKLAFKSESTGAIESGVDSKIYKFLIPVTTTSDGHIYSKLSLDDGQHTDIDSYISIYIDSTAPSMYDTSNDKQNFTAANISALRLTSSSANVSDTNVVENSNSVYTFGDSIYEADSGLSCIAFYFERPASTTFNTKNRVYSPMYNSSDNNITPVADSASDGSVYINSEGLPALYKTGTKRSSTKTIEYSGLGSNLNIRAGGLVKIGGSYCLISSISGDVATIDTDVSESITTTEFIYAQVVNHKVTEGPTDNDYTTVQNDDADGMIESLHQTGTSYSWTASVFSNNIKDGPIQIHAVAIDNAGNTNHAYVSTSVQNNRPRIAKVMLGTDINGNGTYDYFSSDSTGPVNDLTDDATASGTQYGEFSYYSTLDLAGKSQSTSTLNPVSGIDTFVVKNGMCVIPDFTSGNGDLKYTYMVSDSSAAAVKTTAADRDSKDGAITALTSKATLTDETTPIVANRSSSSGLIADQISSKGGLTISTDTLKTYESWVGESKATKYFAFTFWDATEETTQGTDSLWALLKVPVIVNVVDDVAPKATINPFHWTSWSDCSTSVDSSGNPEGHIDLGAQPGVAGKVVIDGAAYDETRLGSISMTTPGTGETHEVAKYESGTWSTVKTSWPDNWEDFEITSEEEPSQSGHTVTWKFTVDMTKYGVVKDQVVEVAANDASTAISGGNASALSSDQTTTASPSSYYKMDFVPYIKGISGAYRSRLGRYPVQAGSNMVIEGYNFAKDAVYTVNFYKSDLSTLIDDTNKTQTGTITTEGQIAVTAPAYSSYVNITVSKVATQNNSNSNTVGYNIQAGDYNKGDATPGANYWNDDCYISVWNVNTTLSGSINPRSGVIKKIDSTNSDNGTLYRKKNDGSVSTWTEMTDHHLALWSSDDLQIYGTAQGSAIIKAPTIFADSQAAFAVPIDAVDYTVIKGLPWYVALDNYVSGSSANTWGAGLFIAREGYWWDKTKFNTTNTVSDSEEKQIVEKLGSSSAADARDSSGGYDSVLSQFQNPRIAGYNNDTETMFDGTSTHTGVDYIYISYYDSYAHCLKYAAYKSGHRTTSVNSINKKWGTDNDCKDLVPLMRTADNMTKGYSVVAGYDTIVTNDSTFKVEAGEWSDIAVDGTIPVIVYYNKTQGCIEVARGKQAAPSTGNVHTSTGFTSDNTENSTGWTKTKDIKPEGVSDFGRYVSIAMEPSTGNIHVAAQDVDSGILYYLYLTKSGEKYTTTVCTPVDKTSSVGRWTDIELTDSTKTGYAAEPIISYIDTSCLNTARAMKVAYIDSTATVGGKTVAYWEAMTDPAKYYGYDKRTSVMPDVYEAVGSTIKAKVGVGFNSSMLALDFLRGEE